MAQQIAALLPFFPLWLLLVISLAAVALRAFRTALGLRGPDPVGANISWLLSMVLITVFYGVLMLDVHPMAVGQLASRVTFLSVLVSSIMTDGLIICRHYSK